MICPHCAQNLLHRERGGRRCSKCRREFALEPKESPFGLHDVRIRKLVERLQDGRGLRYTAEQLWYAAGRVKLPDGLGVFRGVRLQVSVTIAGLGLLPIFLGGLPVAAVIAVVVVVILLVDLGLRAVRPWFEARATIQMPTSYNTFRKEVIGRWVKVYDEPPPGVLYGNTIRPPLLETPRYAVLCPDRSVLACLAANNVARTWGMMLADRIDALPPGIPVLLLHDASLPGLAFDSRARAALGRRAITVGLLPHTVASRKSALRLREPRLNETDVAVLRREGLPETDIEWLAAGWWSPIAAVPPAKLLTALERVVGRVEETGDPDRDRARQVGFLSWPTG